MEDIAGALTQILSDPQSVQQIQNMAASLGLSGLGGHAATPASPPPAAPPSGSDSFDLSALSGILGRLNTPPAPAPPPPQAAPGAGSIDPAMLQNLLRALGTQNGGAPAVPDSIPATDGAPDFSALSQILQGIQSQSQTPAVSSSGLSADGLATLLRAGNPPETQQQNAGTAFDLNAMLKLQQAMSGMQSSRSNIDLLLSLKPRLSDKKNKKVDDAIKFMQLVQFFPLLKETGIFSGLEQMLGSFGATRSGSGGGPGGLSGLLSGILSGR